MAAYLRQAWYVAARSDEIGRAPCPRVLLDIPVVLFRTRAGVAVALHDRCPHRFVPLSRGTVIEDTLQCGYHGLRFDATGACVGNPHDRAIPAAARTTCFPVVERYGFVWFWPGDAQDANPDLLPDLAPFDENSGFAVIGGYLPVAANYQLVIDNLLDLSHVEFLHPIFASAGVLETTRTELVQDGGAVISRRWKPGCVPSRFLRMLWDSDATHGDARAHMRWEAPANLLLDVGVTDVGAAEAAGIATPFAHLLTPETMSQTHYFWAMARNARREDAALGAQLRAITERVFAEEDEPMIAAQQAALGPGHDLLAESLVLLPPDAPAMRARRILAARIRAESTRAENTR